MPRGKKTRIVLDSCRLALKHLIGSSSILSSARTIAL